MKTDIMPLINWIKNNNISTPVKLEIGLDKLICHYPETRYFTIKINGHTVTQMVANALGRKISKYGSIIIHGGGMDMGFAVQNDLHYKACREGYNDFFNESEYKYLGRKRGNKYI